MNATRSIATILGLCLLGAAAIAQEPAEDAGIPAQPLNKALEQFADKSGLQIIYVAELAEGKNTAGARPNLTETETLDQLLASTGLEYEFLNANTVTVQAVHDEAEDSGNSRPTPKPVMMAQASEERQAKTSKEQSPGSRRTGTDSNKGEQKRPLEEIIVTGTNIRGAHPASPLRVIDRAEIDSSGVSTVGELLEQLPQNVGGGFNEDGTGVTASASAASSGKSTVNLRGLGASATLVLLNGRRLAYSGEGSHVDVSMIPLSAIERVEVLTDGASAIYGSDAIAGVVNFVLRRDYEGAETNLRFGAVTKGDLREFRAVQTVGKNWENSNILVNYQYYNRGDLEAIDRDFASGQAFEDVANRDEIDILPKQESHNVLISGTHAYANGLSIQSDLLYSVRNAEYDSVESTVRAPSDLDSETKQYAGTIAASFEINEIWDLDLAGVFGRNELISTNNRPTIGSFSRVDTDNQLWSIDPKITGKPFDLPAGKVGIAIGGQYRDETFERRNAVDATTLSQGDRQIWSLFAETSVPIVGEANAIPGVERLELSLAVRHEDYSDFGRTTDPKFGVIWSPTQNLDIRGTWGTSFRAATLTELDENPAFRNAIFLDFPDPSAPDDITTALLEISTQNAQLGPETSTAFTVGFDYQPVAIAALNISMTYFNVKYDDRVSNPTLSLLTAFVNRDAFASIILDNPTIEQINEFLVPINQGFGILNFNGRPFDPAEVEALFDDRLQNLAATDVSGIDFSVSYSFTSDIGDIGLSLNGNYAAEFVNKVTPDSAEDDVINTFLNPVDLRLRAGATWSEDGLSAAVFANYTDSYRNIFFNPAAKIESWTTMDLNASYDTADQFESWLDDTVISFNVRNLFDQDPPSVGDSAALVGSGLVFPIGYDPVNASALGRFVSFEVKKQF